MTDLIDTTEMYLRTILELEEEGIPPLRARIVERLEHSGPTVSQTVGRMERDGLVHVGEDRRLQLSEQGRERAVAVLRKHRLAERLLADVIGLDWAYVHDEACRWEHVMSDQVEQRLLEILDDPDTTPYGTPIPPRPDRQSAAEWSSSMGLSSMSLVDAAGGRATVASLAEAVQADAELLEELFRAHIRPGVVLEVSETSDPEYLRVQAVDVEGAPALELGRETAAHVRIATGA
ncbi:metal-dependent transcriptional regulator [Micrococcus sp. FDAARGOS_333]|uniref:metal-dependent transcriptional regulator n=1 Tax=Micrococcus sp. FDAARGOS_333 TaxID=1930558 RepID=UPI000B4E6DFE|nr:metal-dependent transcriptional regulator [Micrococcus sp. FDAARGOS_333]PNL17365.1 metal-dependent transcriptional regulator [Micrococcus sp. FDAARGOS_333]